MYALLRPIVQLNKAPTCEHRFEFRTPRTSHYRSSGSGLVTDAGHAMAERACSPPASGPGEDGGPRDDLESHSYRPAKVSVTSHGARPVAATPEGTVPRTFTMPSCVWCGISTGFQCEGWRPPIDQPCDAQRYIDPSLRSRAQVMVFGWTCGAPVCTQCDQTFSCCMTCYCYKGGMSIEQAQNIHSELLQTHQGAGNSLFD